MSQATWKTAELGELGTILTGSTPPTRNYEYFNGKVPFVSPSDLGKRKYITEAQRTLSELGAREAQCIPTGSVLVTCIGSTIGKIGIAATPLATNQQINSLIPNQMACSEFVFYQLQRLAPLLRKLAGCQAVPIINKSTLSSIAIKLPSLAEQNKIAEILTCWDKAIELVERLIEEKRVRKIALTLKLITGRLRLPKHVTNSSYVTTRYGAFPRDWKAIKVKDVAEESKLRFDADNNTTVLSCTKHKGLVPSLEYFGKQIFSNDLSNYKVVKLNQFAYATNHIEEGSIGLLTTINRGLVSPIYTVFQTNIEVDPRFLFAVFKTGLYLHIFQSATSASVDRRGSLRWSEFKEIPLWLPSLPEQRDISQFIALLDTELESLHRYATALNDQKRGLMQKLLTGKIRVKV
jgi:type I restriction enzyme S subunit